MDWKLAIEAERAALQRIVALLFALADLAELAGSRSHAVRGFVLWILLRAEAMARNLVTGTPAPIPFCRAGNSPAEAIRLASSLRFLAVALGELSRLTLGCANDADGLPGGYIEASVPHIPRRIGTLAATLAKVSSMALRVWRRTPYDTS